MINDNCSDKNQYMRWLMISVVIIWVKVHNVSDILNYVLILNGICYTSRDGVSVD